MFSLSNFLSLFRNEILVATITVFLASHTSIQAQNENNPWQFFFGINAVDTFPTGAAGSGALFEEFINLEHWNISPYPSYIGVKNYIGAGFSFGTRFSVNSIKKYGDTPASDNYYNIDGIVSYNLNTLFKGETLMPFLELGGGYSIFDSQGAGYFNLGAGIELWLGKNKKTALTFETLYKNTGETYGVKHFQHLMGLAFLFGGIKDRDGDGIPDREDSCPDVPGIALFEGCPDSDGDGIQDSQDACPQVPGTIKFNGCPDTDGDGVKDLDDQCPEEAGTIENNGCPEITQEIIERLQEIGQIIHFMTNSSELDENSRNILDEVYSTLQFYSNYSVVVEGHTDSSGRVSFNQTLSERRANAVMQYLIGKGISPSRISAKGYGETRPADTNETAAGRRKNRRVEFNIQK
jgi:outer membrane protein OmpA-like peptidoglycan-associated protein